MKGGGGMRCEHENALKSHLESGPLLPLYLLYGEEGMTVERWAARLVSASRETRTPGIITPPM